MIRILVPLVVSDEELEEGLAILQRQHAKTLLIKRGDRKLPVIANEKVYEYTQRVLDLIEKTDITPADADWITRETVESFRDHVNPGFLEYRKATRRANGAGCGRRVGGRRARTPIATSTAARTSTAWAASASSTSATAIRKWSRR